jgi:Flp pilus assembly protein TadG
MNAAARPRRQGARGATFLFFLMVAMPLLAFGAMLSVDFTKVLVLTREMSNATGAAALAGAQQYQPNTTVLNRSAAVSEAGALLTQAETTQAVKGRLVDKQISVNAARTEVTVTATYEVRDLAVLPVVAALFGVDDAVVSHTVTRIATVCVPDQVRTGEAARLSSCSRPLG